MDDNTSNAAAIIEHVSKNLAPAEIEVARGDAGGTTLHLIPKELTVFDPKKILDQYLDAPERRKGTTILADVASFCAHVTRFKCDATLIFADLGDAPLVTFNGRAFVPHRSLVAPFQSRAAVGQPANSTTLRL